MTQSTHNTHVLGYFGYMFQQSFEPLSGLSINTDNRKIVSATEKNFSLHWKNTLQMYNHI